MSAFEDEGMRNQEGENHNNGAHGAEAQQQQQQQHPAPPPLPQNNDNQQSLRQQSNGTNNNGNRHHHHHHPPNQNQNSLHQQALRQLAQSAHVTATTAANRNSHNSINRGVAASASNRSVSSSTTSSSAMQQRIVVNETTTITRAMNEVVISASTSTGQLNRLLSNPEDNNNNSNNDHHDDHDVDDNTFTNAVNSGCGWSEVETEGASPSARSLHSAALLNGVMYVFGGYDGSQRVNSFHAFSFADKRWSPVLPSANSGPPPSPRDRHASAAFANSFYVHGGFDGTARDSSLFCFDFSTMAWREVVATQGRPPSARHSHTIVVYDHSMYVFGGYDGSYKSDLHEYDFTVGRWSAVPAVGRRPRPRYRATCVVYKNSMILYGGHDGTRHLSDTCVFDFDTMTWNSLITDGPNPIPRDSHVASVHGNSMYVFGGSSGSAMNDLHELQLPAAINQISARARWRPVNTCRSEQAQQPRHRFCHVAVTYSDSMYVFGGYDGADRLNSFVKFDFAVYDLSFEIPPSTIISDFRSMLNNDTLSDITFVVEDKPIYAHKLLLMRSSYFQALFSGHMRESNMDTIRIEQVRYPVFLALLEYLYTDQLMIPFHYAMEYFEAADLFCIHRLKTMCEKRMLQSITVENAAAIFHAADVHSATALRQKSKKYILSHFEEVSKTTSFEEMGRQNVDLVFELLHSR